MSEEKSKNKKQNKRRNKGKPLLNVVCDINEPLAENEKKRQKMNKLIDEKGSIGPGEFEELLTDVEMKKMIKEFKLIPCPNPSKEELKQMEDEYKDCFPKLKDQKYITTAILAGNVVDSILDEAKKEREEKSKQPLSFFDKIKNKVKGWFGV